jgi:homoserine kinase type II
MGVFTTVSEAAARDFLLAYDVGQLARIEGIPAGSVNSNYGVELAPDGSARPRRVFLRVYEEQDAEGARAEARLLAHVAARGVHTPAPLNARDGSPIGELAGKPAALFPWIEGHMRCQAGVTVGDAFKVGVELARVHRAGEGCDVGEGRFRHADLVERVGRIAGATSAELAGEAARLGAQLGTWMARRGDLPRGLIHGDLFRDNVLWDASGGITALLDFESASRGIFAYDLMVTVLAWCFGDGLDVPLARSMVDGYRSVRELEEAERAGLLAEGCLAALRFQVTRITDYAMKAGVGPRVLKDWRRFAMRFDNLEALGDRGLRDALGV